MPWLQRDFVDDFVSDLKTATIDSVDDLVDNFVDDFVNETAIDRKTKNEFANNFVNTKVNNSTQQTILLISHFWHFKALKHWFDWLKKILTYSLTPRLALGWTITSFCIFISTFVRAQKSRVLSPRTRNLSNFGPGPIRRKQKNLFRTFFEACSSLKI